MTVDQSLEDDLLNYERKCYNEGYAEGLSKGREQGFVEGRELGIQTGFQRYLSLGVLAGRAELWNRDRNKLDEKVLARLDKLSSLVDVQDYTNNPSTVEKVDFNIKQALNKARNVASATKSPAVNAHEIKIAYQREDNIEDLWILILWH